MSIYAVIAPAGSQVLTDAMTRVFGGDCLEFMPGQFVAVSQNLTTQGVTNELGGTGQVGQIVVFQVASYWGFHRKELWDWLLLKGALA